MDLNNLITKYPELFKYLQFGIECGNGWYKLLDKLCDEITKACKRDKIEINVIQVKEKYGSLRFYVDSSPEEIDKLIDKAEFESEKTCEICGEPGEIDYELAWLRCRCEKCEDIR